MGSTRDQTNSYLQQLEDNLATLRQQVIDATTAQSVAEIRAATAEAEARAAQEEAGKMDELRTSMSALQVSEALARASAESLGNEIARERQARTEAETARIAEAKRVDKAIEEFAKATQIQAPTQPAEPSAPQKLDSDKPIKLRSVVRERDGNGRSLVVDHEVIE